MDEKKSTSIISPLDAYNELYQDSYFFELLMFIKRNLKNIESKNSVAFFLKRIAPVICYELSVFLEEQNILDKSEFYFPEMKNKVQIERVRVVKEVILNSTQAEVAMKEMGLDFKNRVYDINVVIKNDELLSTNYENYFSEVEANIPFYDSLFDMPRNVLKALNLGIFKKEDMNGFDNDFEVLIKENIEKIDLELNGDRLSYSSKVLLSYAEGIQDKDKLFILYRYGILKNLLNIEKLCPNIQINTNLGTEPIILVKKENFFRKVKAVFIEDIGQEIMKSKEKSNFIKSIFNEINEVIIDKRFFQLNRKIRNNIHYSQINELTDKELDVVDTFQNKYLYLILNIFDSMIHIEVDENCKKMNDFFKIVINHNISKKELSLNYEEYYLEFIETGDIQHRKKPKNV